jgi:penicillin-binding protein 1A
MVKLVRFLFICTVLVGIAGCGFVGITIWYFGRDLPDYQQLARYQPPIATRIQAGDGRLLAEYATERRVFVPITAIPKPIIKAFLSSEDKNFYNHHGVDPISILRAAVIDIGRWHAKRRPVGASTITQQVAKNMLLSNELSMERKIKEILLATRIDEALPKDRILELYLNEIYLGSGSYGIAAAALTYFNKSLEELTLGEAAFLAGLPKAPNNYNPVRFAQAARARRDWVLDRMLEDGNATAEEVAAAKAQAIEVHHRQEAEKVNAPYFAEEVRRELLARFGDKMLYQSGLSVRTSVDARLQAIADKTLRQGLINYDRSVGGWRGPVGRIDISGDWQARFAHVPLPPGADTAGWQIAVVLRDEPDSAAIGLQDGTVGHIPFAQMKWARPLREDSSLGAYPRNPADVAKPGDVVLIEPLSPDPAKPDTGKPEARNPPPKGKPTTPAFNLCQIPEVSGALVVIDPHTGRVLALSGGFSYEMSQFNRATQAKRQPGSAIKPFVYLTALDHDFTPSTIVVDGPISLPQGPGMPMWSPVNYEKNFMGPIPLREALAHSRNAATVHVAATIGIEPIAQTLDRFGIMDHTPREYSMSLGAGETTPLRLTAAYAMVDNGGKRIIPTLIDRIQDRNGATIYRADQRPCDACSDVEWNRQAPPAIPDTREQVADPMSTFQLVQMMEGVVQHGTGATVRAVGRPIAGKTGTTSDWQDAWFLGFTPDLAAGVFVGYDEPVSLGEGEQAAIVAAPIFRDFMIAALKGTPVTDFRIPSGMRVYQVATSSGTIWEAYKPGTEPGSGPNAEGGGLASQGDMQDNDPDAPFPQMRGGRTLSGTGGLY